MCCSNEILLYVTFLRKSSKHYYYFLKINKNETLFYAQIICHLSIVQGCINSGTDMLCTCMSQAMCVKFVEMSPRHRAV